MFTITVLASKGGVGKTTTVANLGGLLHDIGFRVLLIDGDIQPSLSRYYELSHKAPFGLTQLVQSGALTQDCISHCQLPPTSYQGKLDKAPKSEGGRLHIVRSDAKDSSLQVWMANRNPVSMQFSFKNPLKHPAIASAYDVVIIDTQGAVGHLQDAAVVAADLLLVPATPDMISAREFIANVKALIERHDSVSTMGLKMPQMKAFLNKSQKTSDSKEMSAMIRESFIELSGKITMADTDVPDATAWKKAASAGVPVHWIDPVKASNTLHSLLWEIVPSVSEMYASNHPQYLDLNAPSN